nr:Mariner Mos1 transposase [Hymenolepis microstoma]
MKEISGMAEAQRIISDTYGKTAISDRTCRREWFQHFKSGTEDRDSGAVEKVVENEELEAISIDKPLAERFEAIIHWLSVRLNIPLNHISLHSLLKHDPLNLHNLLELLNLCIDVNEGASECRPIELISDHSEVRSSNSSLSKEDISANLEKSRLKYLQCKLAEILPGECPAENFSKPIELFLTSPETESVPRVKFADEHEVIPSSVPITPRRSTRSILLPISRPLSRSTSENSIRFIKFSGDSNRQIRRLNCTPYAKSGNSEAETIFNELLKQLGALNLSRDTHNYIKVRLQSYMKGENSPKITWNSAECRLLEMSERQQRIFELAERSEEELSRLQALRNSKAVENLVVAELHQKRRQEVSDRYLNIRHAEQLRAYENAKKIEEERIIRKAFDTALEKARNDRIEEKNLMREVLQKKIELQNTLINNLENRYEQRVRLLKDEEAKRQEEAEVIAKSNRMENLEEKMALRKQLTQQIKELEEALLNQIRS